jgi:hypothetical protein
MKPGRLHLRSSVRAVAALVGLVASLASSTALAGEPDAKTYWDVSEIRAGMKGVGRTVMTGTALEEFEAEVLGVMKGVSPGRDMILCRLKGCKLEHSGIIQGMSGSPIYIDGKLLGAVAFAWEFAKDPIAGVTPFSQMVQYARSSDRQLAAEALENGDPHAFQFDEDRVVNGLAGLDAELSRPHPVSSAALAGMKPIATPVAATGFSPRALALLGDQLRPIGLAPTAGGGATDRIKKEEGDKPLKPGSPLSIAMVTGDFDLSGIGTVTHIEGDRVYGFGHPMFGLGSCQFPMMTGYIHTVYPRASVSMKMGSPLKTVGVLDTDVSTGVAGRLGKKPDMLPMSVKVRNGRYSESQTYNVEIVREPNLLASLVMAVLTNAIDTEGDLPDELTAHLKARIRLKDHDPIELDDVLSGARYTGPMGPAAMFGQVASSVSILTRNPFAQVRIESIDAEVEVERGRSVAAIESVRLASDRVEPGQTLRAFVTLKPYKGERQTITVALPIPTDFPEGSHEANLCDMAGNLRRRLRNEPQLLEPRDVASLIRTARAPTEQKRTALSLHVPLPDKGLAIRGQALPDLPGSVRSVFATGRETPEPQVRADLVGRVETPWVIEGNQTLKFTVAKDAGLSLASPR